MIVPRGPFTPTFEQMEDLQKQVANLRKSILTLENQLQAKIKGHKAVASAYTRQRRKLQQMVNALSNQGIGVQMPKEPAEVANALSAPADNEAAKKDLQDLMRDDENELTHPDIKLKRDSRGAIRITVLKKAA